MNAHPTIAPAALPPIDPLTREMIGEVVDMGAKAKGWLRSLPWAQAEAGMREIDEMVATITECLPGGYLGRCECGCAVGNADPVRHDEEGGIVCPVCVAGFVASIPTVTPVQEPVDA